METELEIVISAVDEASAAFEDINESLAGVAFRRSSVDG